MDKDQILRKLNEIFRDVLDEDSIVLTRETVADDVEDWDSLTHIQLIVAIEKQLNIKFTASEIQHFNNVGDMCDSILDKLN